MCAVQQKFALVLAAFQCMLFHCALAHRKPTGATESESTVQLTANALDGPGGVQGFNNGNMTSKNIHAVNINGEASGMHVSVDSNGEPSGIHVENLWPEPANVIKDLQAQARIFPISSKMLKEIGAIDIPAGKGDFKWGFARVMAPKCTGRWWAENTDAASGSATMLMATGKAQGTMNLGQCPEDKTNLKNILKLGESFADTWVEDYDSTLDQRVCLIDGEHFLFRYYFRKAEYQVLVPLQEMFGVHFEVPGGQDKTDPRKFPGCSPMHTSVDCKFQPGMVLLSDGTRPFEAFKEESFIDEYIACAATGTGVKDDLERWLGATRDRQGELDASTKIEGKDWIPSLVLSGVVGSDINSGVLDFKYGFTRFKATRCVGRWWAERTAGNQDSEKWMMAVLGAEISLSRDACPPEDSEDVKRVLPSGIRFSDVYSELPARPGRKAELKCRVAGEQLTFKLYTNKAPYHILVPGEEAYGVTLQVEEGQNPTDIRKIPDCTPGVLSGEGCTLGPGMVLVSGLGKPFEAFTMESFIEEYVDCASADVQRDLKHWLDVATGSTESNASAKAITNQAADSLQADHGLAHSKGSWLPLLLASSWIIVPNR